MSLMYLTIKIEELLLKKGEITQSIHIIQEQEQKYEELDKFNENFTSEMKRWNTRKDKQFNVFFTELLCQLYGEKYFAVYNKNWNEKKKFSINYWFD